MHQNMYNKAKKTVTKDLCMNFYDTARPRVYASGTGLGARLLQVRADMNCGCDVIPDNAILHLTAFASKSLSQHSVRPLGF